MANNGEEEKKQKRKKKGRRNEKKKDQKKEKKGGGVWRREGDIEKGMERTKGLCGMTLVGLRH